MRRFLTAFVLSLLPLLASAAGDVPPAEGDQRIALVIGNGNYASGGQLANPVHDATDMAAKLRELGFAVILRTDADYLAMRRALTDFGREIREGTVALFFYAGHGMQVRGKNYLLPVDARIQIENDVGTEAMDVDFVLDKLTSARLSMVILDACRNNPFERRFRGGSGAGLAQMAAPTGTLIAYATAPGKIAADGEGHNGLYTGELLRAMSVPGLQVEDVFKHVRARVVKLSGETQIPWEASSLMGSFYFIPAVEARAELLAAAPAAAPTAAPVIAAPRADAPPVKAAPAAGGEVGEERAWTDAEHANTAAAYLAYLKAFPDGTRIGEAKARATRLKHREGMQQLGMVLKDCPDCPEMVVVPAGHFEMGSSHGAKAEMPVHNVTIEKAFALGRTEVTQGQWRAIMGSNPSHFSACGDNCPVENVCWEDVQAFLQRLNARTGQRYRLPTEAEWEYGARAQTTSHYAWGDGVGSNNANCDGCGSRWDNRAPAPVASFPPNGFGLYDMHGNVAEWVDDCWNENYEGAPEDGSAWVFAGCTDHVLRGGSWGQDPRYMRSAARSWGSPGKRLDTRGFRLARTL